MVFQTPHRTCKDHHCAVWERCTRILTARFACAKKATPLLKELPDTYGSLWSSYIVQAATCCACYGEGEMEQDDITAHGYYTTVQMDMMVKMKKKQIKSHQKKDAITTDDNEDDDEGEEDVIIISNDEGWETCLPEVE